MNFSATVFLQTVQQNSFQYHKFKFPIVQNSCYRLSKSMFKFFKQYVSYTLILYQYAFKYLSVNCYIILKLSCYANLFIICSVSGWGVFVPYITRRSQINYICRQILLLKYLVKIIIIKEREIFENLLFLSYPTHTWRHIKILEFSKIFTCFLT